MRTFLLSLLLLSGCVAGPVKRVSFTEAVKPDQDRVGICYFDKEKGELTVMSATEYKKLQEEEQARQELKSHRLFTR